MCCLVFNYSLQGAHRLYCNPAKGTSESQEDSKNQPIRFSTSKARHLTVNQTLGPTKRNASNKPMYIGFVAMAILTYIIFFLPASEVEEDEWDLLEDADTLKKQNTKGQ